MKNPPISPSIPTAIQTVFITKRPANPPKIIDTMIETTKPIVVSINPRIDVMMRPAMSKVTATIPEMTHGKKRLPKSPTTGPKKIIKMPRAQGYFFIKLEKFITWPAGHPDACEANM